MASTIELGQPTNLRISLCPAYVRGEAYLMLHDGSRAATEFQKFINHRGLVVNFPWGALARLGLARARFQCQRAQLVQLRRLAGSRPNFASQRAGKLVRRRVKPARCAAPV